MMTPLSNPLTADPITSILFWIDPEGRMLDASDGARRALGYDPVRVQLPTPLRHMRQLKPNHSDITDSPRLTVGD